MLTHDCPRRLEELRQHESSRQDEVLRSRQVAQRLGIEEAHMLEFQQFNSMWDRTMKEYEARAAELLEAMRQRHELDRAAAAPEGRRRRQPAQAFLQAPRSAQDRAAARQAGEYAEAHRVKLRADALEAEERAKAVGEREQQLAKAETTLLHRQDQEVNALRQRITDGRRGAARARQQDLERLLRRYHNIKNELEAQQNVERQRQRKGVATLPGARLARLASGHRMQQRREQRSGRRRAVEPREPDGRPASARKVMSRPPVSAQRPGSASRTTVNLSCYSVRTLCVLFGAGGCALNAVCVHRPRAWRACAGTARVYTAARRRNDVGVRGHARPERETETDMMRVRGRDARAPRRPIVSGGSVPRVPQGGGRSARGAARHDATRRGAPGPAAGGAGSAAGSPVARPSSGLRGSASRLCFSVFTFWATHDKRARLIA